MTRPLMVTVAGTEDVALLLEELLLAALELDPSSFPLLPQATRPIDNSNTNSILGITAPRTSCINIILYKFGLALHKLLFTKSKGYYNGASNFNAAILVYCMLRPLLLLLLVVLALFTFSWVRRQPPENKRKLFRQALLGLLIIALILLALTGRIHWIGAVIAAFLPFAKMLLGLGLQLFPLWRQRQQQKTAGDHPSPDSDLAEALDTLGLTNAWQTGKLTVDEVHAAHKRLMQKVHPDRGGNDWLAAKVNRARETVLKHL